MAQYLETDLYVTERMGAPEGACIGGYITPLEAGQTTNRMRSERM